MKRLGNLPFDFSWGSCGSFIWKNETVLLLCFEYFEKRKCQSLKRLTDNLLSTIEDFDFDLEFNLKAEPSPHHSHYSASIANYKGFPMVLGGCGESKCHNKLEIFDFNRNQWFYGDEYTLSST